MGSWHDPANHDVALALRWTGTAWEQVPTPPTTFNSVFLRAVAAVSPTHVWAVGDANGRARALKWDGTSWRNMPVPRDYRPSATGCTGSRWFLTPPSCGQSTCMPREPGTRPQSSRTVRRSSWTRNRSKTWANRNPRLLRRVITGDFTGGVRMFQDRHDVDRGWWARGSRTPDLRPVREQKSRWSGP